MAAEKSALYLHYRNCLLSLRSKNKPHNQALTFVIQEIIAIRAIDKSEETLATLYDIIEITESTLNGEIPLDQLQTYVDDLPSQFGVETINHVKNLGIALIVIGLATIFAAILLFTPLAPAGLGFLMTATSLFVGGASITGVGAAIVDAFPSRTTVMTPTVLIHSLFRLHPENPRTQDQPQSTFQPE